MDLYRARERYSLKLRTVGEDSSARKPWHSLIDKQSSGPISSPLNLRGGMSSGNLQIKKLDGRGQVNSSGLQKKDSMSGSDSQYINQSGLAVVRKKRVHAQVSLFLQDSVFGFHVRLFLIFVLDSHFNIPTISI